VTLATFSRELPAASRMARIFANTSPAVLTAWLYVAGGFAAFGVNTI
jgi:hypothetical protein